MEDSAPQDVLPAVARRRLRPYPLNSGHAAARIVALALVANGRIKAVEVAALDAADAPRLLGIEKDQWHEVIRHLCMDLSDANSGRSRGVCGTSLRHLLDEVTDPAMRHVAATLSACVIHADGRVEAGELALLEAIELRWRVPCRVVPLGAPRAVSVRQERAPRSGGVHLANADAPRRQLQQQQRQ